MLNIILFEIASGDKYRRGAGSSALLALRRFGWRSLKQIGQIGAGLLSLFLVVSIAAHNTAPADTMPADTMPADTASTKTTPKIMSSMSMSPRRLNQPSDSLFSSKSYLSEESSAALPAEGKPFQVLRPKMTYHRLTTSRFSIPAGD